VIDSFRGKFRFLSNFYPSEVEYEGVKFPTVEHAFQAAKSLDAKTRRKFVSLETPGDAKRYGNDITLRNDWEAVKVPIMEQLLRQKFKDGDLKKRLAATGTQELIEGNTWNDRFWGVCDGVGQNNLGKLLMKIRDGK